MKCYRTFVITTAAIFSICCTSCVDESTLSGIEITRAPAQTTYSAGEYLNIAGMEVTGYYANNQTALVEGYTFEPSNRPLNTSDRQITVSYKGYTAVAPITVTNGPDDPNLYKIEIATMPNKVVYNAGDYFDPAGMVVKGYYKGAVEKQVYNYTYEPNRPLAKTDTKIIVSANSGQLSVNVPITVNGKIVPVDEYYKDIDENASTLLNDLRSLNKEMRLKTIGYGGLPALYRKTDVDPDGSGKILSFYSRKLLDPKWDPDKNYNREHVWPKSLGGDLVENDAHMARPTDVSDNSDRGNKVYAASGAYDPACLGYANYRGICARIIFYCMVASDQLTLKDSINCYTGSNSMGKLSDLLKWNLQYLPSDSSTAPIELKVEQQRNNVIAQQEVQGNRNPFIDHPEYACKIWGTTNAATRAACGM